MHCDGILGLLSIMHILELLKLKSSHTEFAKRVQQIRP